MGRKKASAAPARLQHAARGTAEAGELARERFDDEESKIISTNFNEERSFQGHSPLLLII